ncbi:hypothetical protein TNCV_1144191 [Trichonephila clavipes]|nr:hypothetical protein TNCV_1144191 [Trichonephila clavipes]
MKNTPERRSDKQYKVWRQVGKELDPKNTIKTVKYGGGSVLVWGCMSAGVGELVFIDGIMNKMSVDRRNSRSTFLRSDWPKPFARKKVGVEMDWVDPKINDPRQGTIATYLPFVKSNLGAKNLTLQGGPSVLRYANAWAVGSLVVRVSDSRPEGLGSMPDATKHPPSTHGFTCKNCGGGDRGRVAIYRPFGEFRRAKSYCHLYGAQGQRQVYLLPMPR